MVERGVIGATLGATIVKDKYWDGMALHRQAQRFALMGWPVSVSVLADQVRWFAESFAIIQRAALEDVLDAYIMHLDGTGLPVHDKEREGGKRLGTLWTYVGGESLAVLYTSTAEKVARASDQLGPEQVLARRTGFVVADADSKFDASFQREDLIECGCKMHARRYFVKAQDRGDTRGSLPLSAFKVLYQIEDEVRGKPPDEILEARQTKSWPVYSELLRWCATYEPHEPPSSPMGRAVRYVLRHQDALTRFIDDPLIPPDNGEAERLHVRAALRRKNYLFAGSDEGAKRAAIAYTVLGCCARVEVSPVEYIVDVLPRLHRPITLAQARELLPRFWKAGRTG